MKHWVNEVTGKLGWKKKELLKDLSVVKNISFIHTYTHVQFEESHTK